jgi:hypothetical protein
MLFWVALLIQEVLSMPKVYTESKNRQAVMAQKGIKQTEEIETTNKAITYLNCKDRRPILKKKPNKQKEENELKTTA